MAESTVFAVIFAVIFPLYQAVTMVHEVDIGDTAVLHCPSNDDSHRFQFWQLQSQNLMIGPTNKFNRDKYKYEVLTGTLYIRGVSSHEQGVYTCICKHISNNSFYAENVELIIKRDWEEVYETDHVFWQTKNLLMKLALSTAGSCLTWTVTGWTQNFLDHQPSQRQRDGMLGIDGWMGLGSYSFLRGGNGAVCPCSFLMNVNRSFWRHSRSNQSEYKPPNSPAHSARRTV